MTDYKLVPIDPTPEMVEAAEDAYMPFGDMEMAIRMAVLAAPAVQGESTASPTSGMNLGQRIQHVGGWETERGTVEFGSVMAVEALVSHVLRDIAVQGEPDVSALVEALFAILEHDSPINIVDTATATERDIFDIARAALAAHRKGGEA